MFKLKANISFSIILCLAVSVFTENLFTSCRFHFGADIQFISETWSDECPTWRWVFETFGTPVLADAGYGAGGSGTGHDSRWDDVGNLTNRINDGVLGVSQYNPESNWSNTISSLRSQIPTPPKCPSIEPVHISPFAEQKMPFLSPMLLSNGTLEVIDFLGKILYSDQVTEWNSYRVLGSASRRLQPGMYILRLNGVDQNIHKKIFTIK